MEATCLKAYDGYQEVIICHILQPMMTQNYFPGFKI